VSAARDVSARLRELERILTGTSDAFAVMREGSGGADFRAIPAERIRRLTALLQSVPDEQHDALSVLTARMLLEDCATAVGRLRAAAHGEADRLDEVATGLEACQKLLWRERKLLFKEARQDRDEGALEDAPAVALAMVPAWRRYYGLPRHDPAAARRYDRLRRSTSPLTMRWIEGLEVVVVPDDENSRAVYVSGLFEPCTAVALRALLHEGDTFVDAGANVGLLTMLASRWVGPSGRVVSFEPSNREFARLQQHLERNALGNVSPVRAALGNRDGDAVLRVAELRHCGHNTLATRFVHDTTTEAYTETVHMVRLDDYASRHGLTRVHVIKIDVEGMEPDVIAGAAETIERDRPALVIEMGREATRPGHEGRLAIEARLRSLGYVFVAVDAETATLRRVHDLTARAENFLATSPAAAAELARQVPIAGLHDTGE